MFRLIALAGLILTACGPPKDDAVQIKRTNFILSCIKNSKTSPETQADVIEACRAASTEFY